MATRYIDKEYGTDTLTAIANNATGTTKVRNLPDAAGFVYDKVDNQFKFNAADTIKFLADSTTTQTLTNKTLTAPTLTAVTVTGASTITGATLVDSLVTSAPIASGSTLTVTAALHAGRIVILNQVAGTVQTMPAATGTGNIYTFINSVALTSVSNIWNAVGSDKFSGGILINDAGGSTAATADFWPATAASSVTLTGTLTAGGGSQGDRTTFTDIATNKWAVTGMWTTSLDPVNPFS